MLNLASLVLGLSLSRLTRDRCLLSMLSNNNLLHLFFKYAINTGFFEKNNQIIVRQLLMLNCVGAGVPLKLINNKIFSYLSTLMGR